MKITTYPRFIRILCVAYVFLFSNTAFAQQANTQTARQFAEKHFEINKKVSQLRGTNQIQQCYQSKEGVKNMLSVFQHPDNGFVVISKSGNGYMVMGYSDDGEFDSKKMPPQLCKLFQFYEDSIHYPAGWKAPALRSTTPVVKPLLDSAGVSLNQFQHEEVGGSWTGCNATAFTQIMAYYKHPKQGIGSHCYTHSKYGELCANFGNTTYDYETEEGLKLLSFHAGIAMDMNYTPNASSAYIKDGINAINNHFKYYSHGKITSDFYIKNELDNRRPMVLHLSGSPEGHAVVGDGYDSEGRYHLNFGWGGSANGFYIMDGNFIADAGGYNLISSRIVEAAYMSTVPLKTNPQDSLALVKLYKASNNSLSWDLSKPVMSWDGVLVMNERVIELVITPKIGDFVFHDAIGDLSELLILDISGTLSGALPTSISKLKKLKRLRLLTESRKFRGELPPDIGNLKNLVHLEIQHISGQIPASIGAMKALKKLRLTNYDYNSTQGLSGNIPHEIGNLTQLEELNLSNNSLSGNIPIAIGNLTSLKYLYLKKNKLAGKIPSQLGNLRNLIDIDLSNNRLTGAIPTEITNLTELTSIHLDGNLLSDAIPASISNLTKLKSLDISNNNLSGAIPQSITTLPELWLIELNNNQLTEMPTGGWNNSSLKVLKLHHNKLQDITGIGGLDSLRHLSLNNNQLSVLADDIGNLSQLEELHIDDNQLTTLPESIAKLYKLNYFTATRNGMSTLPNNFGSFGYLRTINFSHNQLTKFPEALCLLKKVENIDFSYNQILRLPAYIYSNRKKPLDLNLRCNEMSGEIPEQLLTFKANYDSVATLQLDSNRFVFKDIPRSQQLKSGVGFQQIVPLTNNTIKVMMGDTVYVDIRKLCQLSHPDNEYYWCTYPKFTGEYYFLFRPEEHIKNPILRVIIDEKTIKNNYYCKVINKGISYFTNEETNSKVPCLGFLDTDTISFQLASEEAVLSQRFYEGAYIASTAHLPEKTVSDQIVTLIPPKKIYNTIQWQASADGKNWYDINASMTQEDLKANLAGISGNELKLTPRTPAFYRFGNKLGDCTIYSDTIKVNPFGKVLYDEIVNVSEKEKVISVDSIEVKLPAKIHDKDFRITITKLDNPPEAPDWATQRGSVYDVAVSFGSVFEKPIEIKLKNIDKQLITDKGLPAIKPAYFDDASRQWKTYDNGGITLKDSTVVFFTYHLTKLAWYELAHGSFTHIHTGIYVNVIYKWGVGNEENFYNAYHSKYIKKPKEIWYNSNTNPDKGGTPLLIQDIAGYLDDIIYKFRDKGLKTPSLRFNVYASNLGNQAFGNINAIGYIAGRGYMNLNVLFVGDRDDLKNTLAHEYMHYTQDYYMVVYLDNTFFMEAHAPLAGRMVWSLNSDLEKAEPEENLRQAFTARNGVASIFDLLSKPWDNAATFPVLEKFIESNEANISSTFLHYMQHYREGKLLDVAALLKNHTWGSSVLNWSWRSYIDSQVAAQLNSTLGNEYDAFVRYLIEGSNEKFMLLNKAGGNPFAHFGGFPLTQSPEAFSHIVTYDFSRNNDPVEEQVDMKIPYLASKILFLSNLTPKKNVVVEYKRLHEKDNNYKVYYGEYDPKTETTKMIDISDSIQYNIFIRANTIKLAKEAQNKRFLLFVNKANPKTLNLLGDNFNASFELKATPIPDFKHLTYLLLSSKNNQKIIHYDDNTTSSDFAFSGPEIVQFVTKNKVLNYVTQEYQLNDSACTIEVSYDFEVGQEDLVIYPSNYVHHSVKQVITYNYISGKLLIDQKDIVTNYSRKWIKKRIGFPDVIMQGSSQMEEQTHKLRLKNIFMFEPATWGGIKDLIKFSTRNTAETKATDLYIESKRVIHETVMDDGTTHGETKTIRYLFTEYSLDNNIVLEIYFAVPDD